MKKLKKEIIVQELFGLIAQECTTKNEAKLAHVHLPLKKLADHLFDKYDIKYISELHLYNQLKNYEKEVSMSLFRKQTKADGVYINVLNLHQFKQLIILNKSVKIMLANGTHDLLKTLCGTDNTWNIYLGTGSECYYLAKLLIEGATNSINIYTNNIGIIQLYCENQVLYNNKITLYTRFGLVHPETYSIVNTPEHSTDYFLETTFDAIVQSPRYIKDDITYVVFPIEKELKEIIAHNSKGIKILLLTMFEFFSPEEDIYPYGNILEYDYIITPPEKNNPSIHEKYIHKFPVKSFINYFSYDIYTTQNVK